MSALVKKISVALLLLLVGVIDLWPQSVEEQRIEVQLITVSPGKEIYALDGHTALRFIYPGGKPDYTVNWGVFDFSAPNFLYRFVKGETDYMAWAFPTDIFFEEYRREGRTVIAQTLNLTPQEANELETLVVENLQPENRTYRYNYIYDNCATRPLELIEKAIGHPLQIADVKGFTYGETGIVDADSIHTFRSEMTRSHADYPWYQFGIDIALGNGLDKKITTRERTYSPLFLHDALLHTYVGDDGRTSDVGVDASASSPRPLVKSESVLLTGGRVTDSPTPFLLSPIAASILILLITIIITVRDLRRHRVTRWYDTLIYSVLFLASLLLTFLIFVSVHEATSPNWLYLWINPLTIIPPIFIWIKRCKRVVICYQFCNFVALLLLLIIGISKIQVLNGAFYILIAADILLSARYLFIISTPKSSKPKA